MKTQTQTKGLNLEFDFFKIDFASKIELLIPTFFNTCIFPVFRNYDYVIKRIESKPFVNFRLISTSIIFFLLMNSYGQTTVAIQDFEAVPSTPVMTYTAGGLTVGNITPGFPSGATTRFSGSRGLYANSTNNNFTSSNIDTRCYSNPYLTFRLAALSGSSTNGLDSSDNVIISISSNGGSSYSSELSVSGNDNAYWSYTSGTATANGSFDGNNSIEGSKTFAPSGTSGAHTTDGYSTITLTGLPKVSNLRVRIGLRNNSTNEYWAIDNVAILNANPIIVTSVTISTASTSVCDGTNVIFTASPTNGGTSPIYQWKNNGVDVGLNSPTYTTSSLTNANSITCIMTSNATPCTNGSPATSNAIIMEIIPNTTYYQDADADGFGNSAITQLNCTGTPPGYVANNTDCNDANAAVYPGATEIAYDGLDNNCNGTIDDGFPQIITEASSVSCNTTLSSIYAGIYANIVSGVTGYRFEFTNTSTSAVQTIDRLVQYVHLTDLPTYNYGTTYSLRVMLRKGATWLGYYGASCTVSSPSLTTATGAGAIVSPVCGTTLPTIYASIFTTPQSRVTGYRYRITRSTTSGPEVQILDKTVHYFNLTELATFVYGTTYTVEVAIKTTGLVYSAYGVSCTFTTPIPTILTCGTTVPATGTVFATATLSAVTGYVFEVTNTLTSTIQLIPRSVKSFPVSLITGYSPATTYSIRLAVVSTGVQSPFGPSCSINPSVSARFGDATATSNGTAFKAVGYPNPFETNFTLNVTTTSDAKVQVVVYDMIGKQLESKEVNAADANTLEVGANYPSGVYNIIVSQGENVKSLRMIKR